MPRTQRQNVTVSLDIRTIQKAKLLAAQRSTSISGLLAEQIESLVGENEAYEAARRQALDLMDRGLRLGGGPLPSRESLHER